MWNFYYQGIILAGIVNIFLVIAVVKSNPTRNLNRTFIIPSTMFLIWVLCTLFKSFTDVLLFHYLQRGIIFFIPVGTLQFLLVFLRSQKLRDWIFIKYAYVVSGILFFLYFQVSPGQVWASYVIVIFALPVIIKAFQKMFQQYNTSVSRVERYQIIYLIIGMIAWISGSLFEFISFPGTITYPFSSLGGLTFLSIAAWTILRLRLFDITILTGKLLVYIFLVLLIAVFYFFFTHAWEDTPFLSILKTALTIVLLLLIYEPVMQEVEEWSNRILLRKSYQLTSKLQALSKSIVNIIESDQVFATLLQTLSEAEKISNSSLFIRKSGEDDYYIFQSSFFPSSRLSTIENDKPLISYLNKVKSIIVRDEVERELQMLHLPEKKKLLLASLRTLTLLDAEICVPILFHNHLRGFFTLSSHEKTSTFNRRELELLAHLADRIGIITENARLYERMKKTDRLAAIGQMSTGFAHEIRNPLGAMKATAQHLESSDASPEIKEFLTIIVEEVNRLNEVFERFLSFAHPLKLQATQADLNSLVRKTINLLKNQPASENIRFLIHLEKELPKVVIDENQIKQVLLNLILNAQQAMHQGGTITIGTVHVNDSQSAIKDTISQDNRVYKEHTNKEIVSGKKPKSLYKKSFVELSIKDTGNGISQQNLDKIFNPFFTTKENGSGLGLSIAHRILETHDATIEVHSPPGHGTTFVIKFPMNSA